MILKLSSTVTDCHLCSWFRWAYKIERQAFATFVYYWLLLVFSASHITESESVSHSVVSNYLQTYQASLSMEFSRQESWNGLPFPSPRDLPDSGIEHKFLHFRYILYWLNHQVGFFKACMVFSVLKKDIQW